MQGVCGTGGTHGVVMLPGYDNTTATITGTTQDLKVTTVAAHAHQLPAEGRSVSGRITRNGCNRLACVESGRQRA